jgi:hypothetical protein
MYMADGCRLRCDIQTPGLRNIERHPKREFDDAMTKGMLLTVVLLAICSSPAFSRTMLRAETTLQYEVEGWDTSELDARIEKAVTKAKTPESGREEKLVATELYMERGNLFYTSQKPSLYKFALGDYRRALRLQPDNGKARAKAGQIVEIYKQLGRPVPENGAESDIYNDAALRYTVKPEVVTLSATHPTQTVSNTLPAGVAYVYQIDAEPGRTLEVTAGPLGGSITFSVYLKYPDIFVVGPNTNFEGPTPAGGNYVVKVSSTRPKASYTLNLSLK